MDLDIQEAICREVNSARLSRYEIVEIMYKDTFEEVAKGKLVTSGRNRQLIVRLHGEVDWRSGSSDWTTEIPCLQDYG